MALKLGVLCASCGRQIEIDDDYVPGIRGAELASVYKSLPKSIQAKVPEFAIRPWQKTLTCENQGCQRTHTYGSRDLGLYDDSDDSSGSS